MTEEIGLAQPVEYTEAERRTIATHEAGHATVAWLVGKGRKLEVLSIIKRKDALGLLSHSDEEERFTKTRTEIEALIQIAFGRHGGRGAVLRRDELGGGRGPPGRHDRGVPDGREPGHGEHPHLRRRPRHRPATSSPRSSPSTPVATRSSSCCARPRTRSATMLEENRNVVEALRDALLERDELVGAEILDVIASAKPVAATCRPWRTRASSP